MKKPTPGRSHFQQFTASHIDMMSGFSPDFETDNLQTWPMLHLSGLR